MSGLFSLLLLINNSQVTKLVFDWNQWLSTPIKEGVHSQMYLNHKLVLQIQTEHWTTEAEKACSTELQFM